MLNNILENTCKKYGDKTALLFSGKQYTYNQLKEMTQSLAASFIQRNILPGDKIAFFLTNRTEAILCFLACFKVGATVVPINQFFNAEKLISVFNEAKPKILITEQGLLPELLKVPKNILQQIDCYLTDGNADPDPAIKMNSFAMLIDHNNRVESFPELAENTVATLSFTSGTTGAPKGVTHSQAQLSEFLIAHAKHVNYTPDDRILSYVPIAFAYCYSNQVLPSLYSGSSISLVPAGDWEKILDTIQNDQATLIYVGPTSFVHLLNALNKRPNFNHNLRAVISAGDMMPYVMHKRVKEMLGISIYECIGMTETWLYAVNPLNDKMKLGSMGLTCSGMQVKIINDDGEVLPPNQTGQIVVKGRSVMLGYYSRSEKYKGLSDGWFQTGDCGFLDEEGYLFFRGRKELAIFKNGMIIFPHEIEFALYEHLAVLEAGVISVLSVSHGEKIIAYVSLSSTKEFVNKEVLMNHLRYFLSEEKLPDDIIFLAQLPKGVTGKIDRKLLKNLVS